MIAILFCSISFCSLLNDSMPTTRTIATIRTTQLLLGSLSVVRGQKTLFYLHEYPKSVLYVGPVLRLTVNVLILKDSELKSSSANLLWVKVCLCLKQLSFLFQFYKLDIPSQNKPEGIKYSLDSPYFLLFDFVHVSLYLICSIQREWVRQDEFSFMVHAFLYILQLNMSQSAMENWP